MSLRFIAMDFVYEIQKYRRMSLQLCGVYKVNNFQRVFKACTVEQTLSIGIWSQRLFRELLLI